MNKLIVVVLMCFALVSTVVSAHGDHGLISGQQAMSIAAKSLNKMTFKDYGFEVGKLDASWKDITKEDVSVVNAEGGFYIVKAVNKSDAKDIFFKIAKNGQLLDVKSSNDF
ncbi:DUF6488 family protein [Pseudoalteromonas elyakovii]|nr:DUF6488 family protein [Pseudoalteromonas elyakovii]